MAPLWFAIFAQQGDVPTLPPESAVMAEAMPPPMMSTSPSPCGAGIPGRCSAAALCLPNTRQHLPLAAMALHLLHDKTGGNQPPSHETGAGKGRRGGIRGGRARRIVEEILGPHLWVLGRGETVQIPRRPPDRLPDGAPGAASPDVAKPEIEADAAIGKEQAMAAGNRQQPLVDERLAQGGELWPGGPRALQIGLEQGYFSTLMKCSQDPLPDRGLFQKRRPLWPES